MSGAMRSGAKGNFIAQSGERTLLVVSRVLDLGGSSVTWVAVHSSRGS